MIKSILGQIELPYQCDYEYRLGKSEFAYLMHNPQSLKVVISYCAKRDDQWEIVHNLSKAQSYLLAHVQDKLKKIGYEIKYTLPGQQSIFHNLDDGEEVYSEYEREYSAHAFHAQLDKKVFNNSLKAIKEELKQNKKTKAAPQFANEYIYKTSHRCFDFTKNNWDRFNSITLNVKILTALGFRSPQNFDLTFTKDGQIKLTDKQGNELKDELYKVVSFIEEKISIQDLIKTIFTNNRVFAVRCLTYFLLLQPWNDNLVDVKFSNSRLKSQ